MESIPRIESEGQEHFTKFNFRTKKIHDNRISGENIVETRGPKKSFYPPELFPSWEDVNNPDRTVDDLVLDCWWDEHGNIEMPVTEELLAMLREADPDSIIWAIILKEKTQEGPMKFGDIEYIGVNYLEKERTEKEATTDGGTGTETKTAKVDKKEKRNLRIVRRKVKRTSRKKRHGKPARDVLKYFSRDPTRLGWPVVLKAMYKYSMYLDIKVLANYTGRHNRKGRFYLKGNEFLADSLGVSERTVKRALAWLKLNDVIYLRHRGYPGEGNSIWELPFNFGHVKGWKRKPPR